MEKRPATIVVRLLKDQPNQFGHMRYKGAEMEMATDYADRLIRLGLAERSDRNIRKEYAIQLAEFHSSQEMYHIDRQQHKKENYFITLINKIRTWL